MTLRGFPDAERVQYLDAPATALIELWYRTTNGSWILTRDRFPIGHATAKEGPEGLRRFDEMALKLWKVVG